MNTYNKTPDNDDTDPAKRAQREHNTEEKQDSAVEGEIGVEEMVDRA
jgi:hypothetical protein